VPLRRQTPLDIRMEWMEAVVVGEETAAMEKGLVAREKAVVAREKAGMVAAVARVVELLRPVCRW
jgi:hypothetical protein